MRLLNNTGCVIGENSSRCAGLVAIFVCYGSGDFILVAIAANLIGWSCEDEFAVSVKLNWGVAKINTDSGSCIAAYNASESFRSAVIGRDCYHNCRTI